MHLKTWHFRIYTVYKQALKERSQTCPLNSGNIWIQTFRETKMPVRQHNGHVLSTTYIIYIYALKNICKDTSMLIAESESSNPIIWSVLTSGSPCLCLFKLHIVLDFAQCALQFYSKLFTDRNPNYSPQEASPLTLGWHTAPLTGGGRLTIPFAPT